MAKRYYWLKLPDDWFRQKPIKKLRRIAGGDTHTIIYLKMLLVAIKQDGKLYFEGVEDNFVEELALEIDEDPENVQLTVSYLQKQHLLEIGESDEYYLPEAKKMTGSESESAERVRRLRERKALQCNTSVTEGNGAVTQVKRLGNGEKEIEKEIEIEIDNNIYSPEASSGQDERTDPSPAGFGVNKGTPTADGAKEIGTGARKGVQGIDACKTEKLNMAAGDEAPIAGAAFGDNSVPGLYLYLILNTHELYPVTVGDVEKSKAIYPAVDVEQELRNMFAWCNKNRKNRKTRSGIGKFINGWLAREQNKAPRVQAGAGYSSAGRPAAGKVNQFNQFRQNDYDFDALEAEMQNWSSPKEGNT